MHLKSDFTPFKIEVTYNFQQAMRMTTSTVILPAKMSSFNFSSVLDFSQKPFVLFQLLCNRTRPGRTGNLVCKKKLSSAI